MSESAIESSPFSERPHDYALSSELAKLCLPAEYKDDNRRLAWVNSICFLFLVIGLVGLKSPKVVVRAINIPTEQVAVVFTPPEEAPKTPDVKPDEPQPQEAMDTPTVTPVLAAIDSKAVAFAVPVEGAIAVKEAKFATPPPPVGQAPPRPRTFIPGHGEGGRFPWPTALDYPRDALAQQAQGKVVLDVIIDASGAPVKVEIKDSSGHVSLDRASQLWVKNKWHWLPGEERHYYVPFVWQLQ
jgi:TonB family protein